MDTYQYSRAGIELTFTVADIRRIHGQMREANESGMVQAHGELLMKADDSFTQRLVREFGDVYQVYLDRANERQAAFDAQYGPVKTMEYKVLEPLTSDEYEVAQAREFLQEQENAPCINITELERIGKTLASGTPDELLAVAKSHGFVPEAW